MSSGPPPRIDSTGARARPSSAGSSSYSWRRPSISITAEGEATDQHGTIITFWPDGSIFETTEWNFETLSRRLQEMAFLVRGLAIVLTDQRPAHINGEPRVVTYQYDGGIADFVRYLNGTKDPVHGSVIEFGGEGAGISAEIAMQWNASYAESVHTFANTINTATNGRGPLIPANRVRDGNEVLCNAPGRGIGPLPRVSPGFASVEAFLWTAPPGNSSAL